MGNGNLFSHIAPKSRNQTGATLEGDKRSQHCSTPVLQVWGLAQGYQPCPAKTKLLLKPQNKALFSMWLDKDEQVGEEVGESGNEVTYLEGKMVNNGEDGIRLHCANVLKSRSGY